MATASHFFAQQAETGASGDPPSVASLPRSNDGVSRGQGGPHPPLAAATSSAPRGDSTARPVSSPRPPDGVGVSGGTPTPSPTDPGGLVRDLDGTTSEVATEVPAGQALTGATGLVPVAEGRPTPYTPEPHHLPRNETAMGFYDSGGH